MKGAIVGDYRVDPDRVIGVLAGVDDAGAGIARAIDETETLALEGLNLVVDGRRTLASAWSDFLDERRYVPGKLANIVAASASAVSEATTAVVTGDVDMSFTTAEAESRAVDEWGIDSSVSYGRGY
ncbi:hypothetical protein [Microbacterium sp. IEGM 1404]|uniref:hypothetical protein n=1 Tax=Microbacterium sp. IEGM 1404 TaxID=3047084 RepID=UPI0024B6396E|nr:hypothetical protein [Microbacterium sp. IEGM 1404]MDI9890392.1 hypothetical protein [Microbacterium sp. IEGM 1404]